MENRNERYWQNKTQRAAEAAEHVKDMEERFPTLIADSISFSTVNDEPKSNTKIIVEKTDSVSAVMKYAKLSEQKFFREMTAVLNFASYKNPGGKYLEGSSAQEESLCRESTLYNVLSSETLKPYYEHNRENLNRGLYEDRLLYSPNIVFCRNGEEVLCDVITCAAPNKHVAQKYQHVSDAENRKALRKRISFILNTARDTQVDTLILGAWGCGVFGQDPQEVAEIFKEQLEAMDGCFGTVVFAVLDGKENTYDIFNKMFSE